MIKANWVKYKNGNYNVILNLNDGTKIRETIDPEATKGWGDSVKIIGNIIKDKWFDAETFFADKKENIK